MNLPRSGVRLLHRDDLAHVGLGICKFDGAPSSLSVEFDLGVPLFVHTPRQNKTVIQQKCIAMARNHKDQSAKLDPKL